MFATNESRQDYTLPLAVKYLKLGIDDAGALFLLWPVDGPGCALVWPALALGGLNAYALAWLVAGADALAWPVAGADALTWPVAGANDVAGAVAAANALPGAAAAEVDTS